jgi:hypothetical protein
MIMILRPGDTSGYSLPVSTVPIRCEYIGAYDK